MLTAVGSVLVVGDDVLVALGLEPVADAEGVLGAADEVGVPVGVLAALVEQPTIFFLLPADDAWWWYTIEHRVRIS
jgi:hypothetical protein